jgi:hypothetical protein
MDDQRFDHWTRSLFALGTRRATIKSLTGAELGATLTHVGTEPAAARCVKPGKPCDRKDGRKERCCGSDRCKRKRCTCGRGREACGERCCPQGHICAGGACVTGQDACPNGQDTCVSGPGPGASCGNNLACGCFQRRQGGTRCVKRSPTTGSDQCVADADCRTLGFPAGTSCTRDEGGFCQGTNPALGACMVPC